MVYILASLHALTQDNFPYPRAPLAPLHHDARTSSTWILAVRTVAPDYSHCLPIQGALEVVHDACHDIFRELIKILAICRVLASQFMRLLIARYAHLDNELAFAKQYP